MSQWGIPSPTRKYTLLLHLHNYVDHRNKGHLDTIGTSIKAPIYFSISPNWTSLQTQADLHFTGYFFPPRLKKHHLLTSTAVHLWRDLWAETSRCVWTLLHPVELITHPEMRAFNAFNNFQHHGGPWVVSEKIILQHIGFSLRVSVLIHGVPILRLCLRDSTYCWAAFFWLMRPHRSINLAIEGKHHDVEKYWKIISDFKIWEH